MLWLVSLSIFVNAALFVVGPCYVEPWVYPWEYAIAAEVRQWEGCER